jgi:hypothetical protein
MRTFTFLLSAVVLCTASLKAQTVANFDSQPLAHADTFYANYSAALSDVGFNDGNAHFPCVYDTLYGGYWSYGFSYSNMTDSVTSGFGNQYSARTAKGYAGSNNYVVSYYQDNILNLTGAAVGHPVSGFYITNSTFAYNCMRDGDFFSRKFHNGDWFKLTVKGYSAGLLKPDSVTFYLANYLFPDTSMNYILKSWQWVNLMPLGNVDSLQFALRSTDNGIYGMNTPAYFCMDNFTTADAPSTLNAPVLHAASIAKVYPNPAAGMLFVDINDNTINKLSLLDMTGRIVSEYNVTTTKMQLDIASLPTGAYILQLHGAGGIANVRVVKN